MNRPSIPEAIKRQVRQECHFGCVLCGMPFFEYDHIVEYTEQPSHDAANLALLCPNHHRAKSSGKLSRERVQEARQSPYNAQKQFTGKFELETSRTLLIQTGNNTCTYEFPDGNGEHLVLWANGIQFFTVHATNRWLSISMELTDSEGNPLLHINQGELCPVIQGATSTISCVSLRATSSPGNATASSLSPRPMQGGQP